MKQLLSEAGDKIAFSESFELINDYWIDADGAKYPMSVVGGGCKVEDYTPPPPVIEPPAPEVRHITKLAFRSRFTMKEKVAIELAGNINPNDPAQKQQLAATVCASNADVAASIYIDLDRPDTRAGVKSMEDFGLLAAGRAAEILDNPVQDFERYNG